jgi:hypothetical protein
MSANLLLIEILNARRSPGRDGDRFAVIRAAGSKTAPALTAKQSPRRYGTSNYGTSERGRSSI